MKANGDRMIATRSHQQSERRRPLGLLRNGPALSWLSIGAFLSLAVMASADEWTCGFEASDGFILGQSPAGAQVSVLGGDASVLSGGAVEGSQFLRFVPKQQENALILNLPIGVAASMNERSIRFAVRLAGDTQSTRLILSHGQTIALNVGSNDIEVEVDGDVVQRFETSPNLQGWAILAIHETPATSSWDLLIGDQPVARGLPMHDPSKLLSDVLIFSDGALDLDAVRVVTVTEDAPESPSGIAPPGAESGDSAALPGSHKHELKETTARQTAISESVRISKVGDIDAAEQPLAAQLTEKANTPEWHLQLSRQLMQVLISLQGEGDTAAVHRIVPRIVEHLAIAQKQAGDPASRAYAHYAEGMIEERFLADFESARIHYAKAVEEYSAYSPGQQALSRMQQAADKAQRRLEAKH